MRKMKTVSAAVFVTVILLCIVMYFVTRTTPSESPSMSADERQVADGEFVGTVGAVPEASVPDSATAAGRQSPIVDRPSVHVPAIAATKVLRVVLDGITEQHAPMVTVTLMGVDERDEWVAEIQDSWTCQGLMSEFDLGPFFARVAEQHESVRVGELEITVDHSNYFLETTRVPLTSGVEFSSGQTVYEVRVSLTRPEFWPKFTLDVRDAHTRAHLKNIELRVNDNLVGMSIWGRNGTTILLGDGLSSPIAVMGGRYPDEVTVAGLALSPASGESPPLVELSRRFSTKRGVGVSARAPGYAWGSTSLNVSEGKRELLLEPAAGLSVRLENVRLERYAALETVPMLCVYWIRADGGNSSVHYERLDETLESEGLRLDNLVPGGYRVAVELGGGSWTKQPVLALEEVSIAAGETGELVLALAEPPAAPQRATLGGVISFPSFGDGPNFDEAESEHEQRVRLQIYFQPTQSWRKPDIEFSLADLERVGGALPTWSFRVEDQPVGLYRVQLLPFLKAWMIDLPAGGREDLELVVPELAEVLIETVDGQTGERVPRDALYYRRHEPLPRQRQNDFTKADTEEPGRFRFWAVPGKVMVWPKYPTGADRGSGSGKVLELIPGLQSVRLELGPVYAMRFEFREGGVALPVGDPGMYVMQNIRAVGHEGRVLRDGLQSNMRVEVSAPGVYEINFAGIDTDRYHSIPTRRVEVRAGETPDVIVELRPK